MNWKKYTSILVILSLIGAYFYFSPEKEHTNDLQEYEEEMLGEGGASNMRQEINIFNRSWDIAASTNATSSELIQIDPTNYSGSVSYYFEVVASTSVSFQRDVMLKYASGTEYCRLTIPAGATSMTLVRSSSCGIPTTKSNFFVVATSSASGATTIKSARVVVLQSFADATNATSTQTQIEIGSYVNASSSTATNPAENPKYWTYSSSAWDGNKTFALQVNYQTSQISSTTLYTAENATTTYITSPGTLLTTVELWGAGGGGRCAGSTAGGSGGAGGAYAKSFFPSFATSTHTIFVPSGGTCGTTTATSSATFDLTTVVAASGPGSAGASGISAATTSLSTGHTVYVGGNSASANSTSDAGGGGGGSAGPNGIGGRGAAATSLTGGGGGGGNGGSNASGATGGTSVFGGAGGNGSSTGNGEPGVSNVEGGGGGGGSWTTLQGGAGGTPGGGGGGGDTTGTNAKGGRGQARITEIISGINFVLQEDNGSFGSWTNVASTLTNTYSTTTSAIFTTNNFTPTDGRHYRLVASSSNSGTTYSIFNAKIVVDQVNYDYSWSAQAAVAANTWNSVTFGNGIFVAVAATTTSTSTAVMTSTDGITWTPQNTPEANTWNSVTFGNGLFVAVAETGTNRVMTSPDGITWTARTASAVSSWSEVTYGLGAGTSTPLFVAVARAGTTRAMTSPDGINWTSRTSPVATQWETVEYGEGIFVAMGFDAAGNGVMTSYDGVVWTLKSATSTDWKDIAYAEGIFVAVGGGGTNRPATSPDGITWTTQSIPPASSLLSVTYGNGLFVAVGSSGAGRVITSPDGVTWTLRTMPELSTWQSVTYGNNKFVAVSVSGTNRVALNNFINIGSQFTLSEPQYLLLNTYPISGTGFQSALTTWAAGDWTNATTTFQHQLESAPSSASDGEVYVSGGALVTGSTVSNPNNLATSTLMTMPVDGTLDMKLTTNNGDVYASRILVRLILPTPVASAIQEIIEDIYFMQ
jgi:hypothetical protein